MHIIKNMEQQNKRLFKSHFLGDFMKKGIRFIWQGIIVSMILAYLFFVLGDFIRQPLVSLVGNALSSTSFGSLLCTYVGFVAYWIVYLLIFGLWKKKRPYVYLASTKVKGNNFKMLGIGFLLGFICNAICVFVAMVTGSVHIQFKEFNPLILILFIVFIFVQSSFEEVLVRGFVYQRIQKAYHKPVLSIVFGGLFFALIHIPNGLNMIAFLSIAVVGIAYALCVYYLDSIWIAFAMHTAWNFTQNIIFGLPNSGIPSTYSIFKIVGATKNGIAFNTYFGVESSIIAIVVNALLALAVIYWGKKHPVKQTDVWAENANN